MRFRTTNEVSQITGATLRELQWWDETKVVMATRQDSHMRLYDDTDVLKVLLVTELRHKGLSLQKTRRVLKETTKRFYTPYPLEIYVLTDTEAKIISVAHDTAAVIARFKQSRRPLILVSLGEWAQKLNGQHPEARRAKRDRGLPSFTNQRSNGVAERHQTQSGRF
jgi:DNA-binding transcriptional MerR regulator